MESIRWRLKTIHFFWKGKVRDRKNHLTHEMAMQLDQIFEQKLIGSGLIFNVALTSS